jgi:hypothetical protein
MQTAPRLILLQVLLSTVLQCCTPWYVGALGLRLGRIWVAFACCAARTWFANAIGSDRCLSVETVDWRRAWILCSGYARCTASSYVHFEYVCPMWKG